MGIQTHKKLDNDTLNVYPMRVSALVSEPIQSKAI